jgi:5-methyltetrahydrofolate--homocysteine methyltransferase
METRVSSATREVIIGDGRPTVLIGERINPAGKKKLTASLKTGSLDIVRQEALEQIQAGADIIDVNVTIFGLDEAFLLPQAVKAVMETVEAPVCLDTTNAAALEAALKIYRGKALINSVSGEESSLSRVLPLVKEYGAAVIGLTQDDEGIPKNAVRRVEIAEKILERAARLGIPPEDIIIDCLALAVGAEPTSVLAALETMRAIKSRLGLNMTLGASNISYGLPDRQLLNHAFLPLIIEAGVNCPVVDAAKVRGVVLAVDLLLNRDKRARRYIEAFRQRPFLTQRETPV